MPDFAMCRDIACPSRLTCKRFTATPCEPRQTYASFDRKPKSDRCSHYWPTTKQTEKEKPHAE